jgi:hypothetical protein
MVAVRFRTEGQSRRPLVGLSFPSPHWGRVRGESSNGDFGHQLTGMTGNENREKLIRFGRVKRNNPFNNIISRHVLRHYR